jgi:hypothetical protein
MAAEEAAAAAE